MSDDIERRGPAEVVLSPWLAVAEEHFGRPTLIAAHLSLDYLASVIESFNGELDRAAAHLDEDLAGINWPADLAASRKALVDALAQVRAAEQLVRDAAGTIVRVFPT